MKIPFLKKNPNSSTVIDITDTSESLDADVSVMKVVDATFVADDYRKKGFYATILGKKDGQQIIDDLLLDLDNAGGKRLTEINELFDLQKQHLTERIDTQQKKLSEQQNQKTDFELDLKTLLTEKTQIETELSSCREKLLELSRSLGEHKEAIIEKRLAAIKNELERVITIHHGIEQIQNDRYNQKDQALNQDRIKFLQQTKSDYQQSFDEVKIRIQAFDKAGGVVPFGRTLYL